MAQVFVKVNGPHAYVHPGNRIEVVEAGSIVGMSEADARYFVEFQGRGEYASGPESLVRPEPDEAPKVERPGIDTRPARAERAVAAPQRA